MQTRTIVRKIDQFLDSKPWDFEAKNECVRNFTEDLAARPSPRILYISCNPLALADDLEYLREGACVIGASIYPALSEKSRPVSGYKVVSLAIFDMFPYTTHIETWMAKAAQLQLCRVARTRN